ncbi:hypothetical protein ACFLZY_01490 [Patescibacteria group bacterium]
MRPKVGEYCPWLSQVDLGIFYFKQHNSTSYWMLEGHNRVVGFGYCLA